MSHYASSSYGGEGGGFVPPPPGAHHHSNEDQGPVIPSPTRGAQALHGAWHPGGAAFLRHGGGGGGGGGDQAWMTFGDPNARGPVFPPAAQHPWHGHGRGRSQDQLRPEAMYQGGGGGGMGGMGMGGMGGMGGPGYPYGASPYMPMSMAPGPSPYLHPHAMGGQGAMGGPGAHGVPDPYFTHGMAHHGGGLPGPHPTPGGMGMGMGMGMPHMMPYTTPGMYPGQMGPWTTPNDMGLPRNLYESDHSQHTLGSKKLGKNYDQSVFVDKWEPGKYYGPVLSTRMISIIKPRFEVNPLLQASTVRTDGDYLEWNMLFPESSAHLSSEPRHQSWRAGRDAPATMPRTDTITIISPYFRWIHTVTASREGKAITCGELLHQTFKFLHSFTAPDEYTALERADPAKHRLVYQNYQRNRSREHQDVPGGSMQQGILKIDFMLMNTMFDGFIVDDKMVHDRLRLPIPHPDHQKKLGGRGGGEGRWREGQGGNGKCILVLLCTPRGVGGGGSAGASPNTRGRDVRENTTPSGLPGTLAP